MLSINAVYKEALGCLGLAFYLMLLVNSHVGTYHSIHHFFLRSEIPSGKCHLACTKGLAIGQRRVLSIVTILYNAG